MKLARRTLRPVAAPTMDLRSDDVPSINSGANTSPGNQLVVANTSKSKSSSSRRAFSRKTRSAVESWIEKFFLSDKDRRTEKNELARRASTGSITGHPSSGRASLDDNLEPRAKRKSSFFSSSRERRAGGKEHSSSSNANASKAQREQPPLWLQPVPSFPALERESKSRSSSHKKVPVSTSSFELNVHEPELLAYVTPPVEMPSNYRAQDRRGGMIVSGRAVLFTNAAFKRKLRKLSQLRVIPENRPAQMHESHLDVYHSVLKLVESSEPLSSVSYSSENDDDIVPLSQWI
jgi:hypothetical protein